MKNKKDFNVIIAGSRTFNNYKLLEDKVNNILKNKKETDNIVIISGNANGADKLGESYANKNHYNLVIKPAEWKIYGKKAGYIRNIEMANIANALIAFWDGKSKGTQHMINIAKEKNLLTRIIIYK